MNNIFNISLAFSIIISGTLKVIYYKYTYNTIRKIDIFPQKSILAVSILMPLFEITQGTFLLIFSNLLTYILILGYLLFFIILNIKAFIGKENKECCCYGKFIKSKLGLGGFIHYMYWLILLIFAIINFKYQFYIINNTYNIYIWFTVFLIIINGLIIRRLLENIV